MTDAATVMARCDELARISEARPADAPGGHARAAPGLRAGGRLGWIEVHIEQGPRLESRGLPVGVVSSIQGASRAVATFRGVAGRAGTMPMDARHDALAAAAGTLSVRPGAANVIPGEVEAWLDVRLASLRAAAGDAGWRELSDIPAVECSPELRRVPGEAVAAAGYERVELASGAGHDAVARSRVCPVARLFVRCAGGISHNPAESVDEADVAVAIDVLSGALEGLAG